MHLGFELERGWWNCWRCGFHKHWDVLLALLDSRELAWRALHEFGRLRAAPPRRKRGHVGKLELPIGLQALTMRARRYLESRKFSPDLLEAHWKLQSTGNVGPHKFRIYIPIYLHGRVVSWQCRDITGKSDMRYLGQSRDREILSNKETLYGIDAAGGKSCVVVEGVTDVWRLGPGAVATFGIKYTPAQVAMLLRNFESFHILFDPPDPQAHEQADRLAHDLAAYGREVRVWSFDAPYDPGDMARDDAAAFMREALGPAAGY